MGLDQSALSDRLYADALSMCLRLPQRFYAKRASHAWKDIEEPLRKRALIYIKDLSVTAAAMERAIERVKAELESDNLTSKEPLRYITLLQKVAIKLLQPSGREIFLKTTRKEPGREILRWRFISLLIPSTILIAAASQDKFLIPKAVRLLNSSMGPDFPVAQNHLHHAAITSFEELWVSLRRRALLEPVSFVKSLQNEKAYCPQLHRGECHGGKSEMERKRGEKYKLVRLKHMAEWADLIQQAFIARRVLDTHVWHSDNLIDCPNRVCKKGKAVLRAFLSGRIKPYNFVGPAYPWREEVNSLGRRYGKYTSTRCKQQSELRSNFIRKETASELRLLAGAFVRLRPQDLKSADQQYEILFLQYLRVKTAVFKLLVHPPGEHGLEKFLEYFSQIKIYGGETDDITPPKPDESGLTVQATEYRVAPDAWRTKLRFRSTVEEEKKDGTKTESAWLIHFKRSKADGSLPLFRSTVRAMEEEARGIAAAIEQEPRRLRNLRGIDICGIEGAQPLWVSAPILRSLRRRSQQTAARRPGLRLEPLHLTVHVGEDFRWLTSGVRAVAEPFQWEVIERGDRIGHGIAVTLEPKRWWEDHVGEVMETTRIDRFLDLAFLAAYTKDIADCRRTPEQTKWLKNELMREAKEIWPKLTAHHSGDLIGISVEIWSHLGRRTTRQLMEQSRWAEGLTNAKVNGLKTEDQADDHTKWIHSYLWNSRVQQKAKEPIRMKVDDDDNDARTRSKRNELELLVEARKRLICEMARWQVCIESCPSSNLIVGSLDAMSAQDFLQKRPTNEQKRGEETLTWTVSTDDPITFSTSLADEYAYAWAGMVLREKGPYDPSYARALLDEAAQTSMRMRFTVPDRTNSHRINRKGNGHQYR
jgi:hypothetical protein